MRRTRSAKLACLALSFTFYWISGWLKPPVQAYSYGPDAAHTGAPGELTCATGECHLIQRGENVEYFRIIGPSGYQIGQTYQITVQHSAVDLSRERWGFQITALTDNAGRAGTWQSLDEQTQIVESGALKRQYAQHTLAGTFAGQANGASWTLNWTAPSTNLGPITFFAAGNQANNNNSRSGDHIFLARLTIPFLLPQPTPTPTPTPASAPLPIPVAPSAGSLLFFDLITSQASNRNAQNTRVNLTNTHETQSVTMRLMMVDGVSGLVSSFFQRLRPQQTASWLATDLDPGTTGFLYVLAVDDITGCPRSFNHLMGDASVKLGSRLAANFAAEAFTLNTNTAISCENNTSTLRFDGIQFNHAPRALALTGLNSSAAGNETLIVLNRFGGDLSNGVGALGELTGLLFDDAGNSFSFTQSAFHCQFISPLDNRFPVTVKPIGELIPTLRTGWLKLWEVNGSPLMGSVLNSHSPMGRAPLAITQGHLLHHLSLAESARLIIPISPPQ